MNQNIMNEYSIKGTIGKGSFSKVKLGINKITGEKVAIKIIDKKKIKMNSDRERVQRELNIIKKLSHINIVKIIQIKEDTNNIYIIMEYIENNLFFYIINNKCLSEQESSFYFFQLISVIDYIHSQGIVHRDLKPENILVTTKGLLKIIDFGLSNYFSKEGKLLSTSCGSPSYTAPEVLLGNKYNGFAVDIWTIGVILYVMLCGNFPFEAKDDNNTLFKKIIKCKVEYPKFIPKCAKNLLEKILTANPEKRITIDKIKEHQFYLNGKNIFYQKFPEFVNKMEINSNSNSNNKLDKEHNPTIKKVTPNFDLLKRILRRSNKSQEKKNNISNINTTKDNTINNRKISELNLLYKLSKEKQIYETKYLLTDIKHSTESDNHKINTNILKYKYNNMENKEKKRRNNKSLIVNGILNIEKKNLLKYNKLKDNNSVINNNTYDNNSFSNRKTKSHIIDYGNNIYENKTFIKRKNLSLKNKKYEKINFPDYLKCLTKLKDKKKIRLDNMNKSEKKRKWKNNDLIIIKYKNISSKNIYEKRKKSTKKEHKRKNKKEDKYNIKEIIKRRGLDNIINKS